MQNDDFYCDDNFVSGYRAVAKIWAIPMQVARYEMHTC